MGLYNPRNKIRDRRNSASRQALKADTCRNITKLLRTCTSHQTDTSEIVDQSYNANCPAILVQKREIQAPGQVLRNVWGCLIFWKKALRRCNVQCY